MIRSCNVIMRNSLIMVVMYDDLKVQLPTDNTNESIVFVKKDGTKYTVVSKEEFDKYVKKNKKIVKNSDENKESAEHVADNIVIDNEE